MAIESVTKLVAVLDKCRLLEPPQLDEVVRRLQPQFRDPRALAKELLQRGWITPYHVNTLFGSTGKVSDLVLGQYVLLEKIGEGGMGQVFKARHLKLNRIVALKVVRKEWLSQPQAVQRFQREIHAAAQLCHPNIVMAFDADQIGETHFIAMEYVEGVDLGKLLKQSSALPLPMACDYIRQAALGLQHACEKGMVHRDIKPSNLLLTRCGAQGSDSGTNGRWGTIKILDMGLARIPRPNEGEQASLTQAGAVVGTPDYISPEQARDSRTADIRSDLYSLGCTFYCLLTGEVLFPGGTGMEKLFKHQLEEPRPVNKLNPSIPPAVAAIVHKLLAKKPEGRYQTPAELVEDLRPYCRGDLPAPALPRKKKSGIPPPAQITEAFSPALEQQRATRSIREDATPTEHPTTRQPRLFPPVTLPRRRFKKRWLLAPLAALVLAGVLLAVIWPRDKNEEQVGPGKPTEPGSSVPITTRPGSPLDALSRDTIPAAERVPTLPSEVVAVLGDGQLRHWGPVSAVALSPDGRQLASVGADRVIRIWDVNLGRQQKSIQTGTSFLNGLAFLADGQTLAAVVSDGRAGSIRLWGPTGTTDSVPLPADGLTAVLAPDGRTAVIRGRGAVLHIYDLATRKERFTVPAATAGFSQSYSADGHLLALLGRQANEETSVTVYDVGTGKELHRLALGKEFGTFMAVAGETVAVITGKGAQVWNAANGKRLFGREVPPGTRGLSFTPDGKSLLICTSDGLHQLDAATGSERGPVVPGLQGVGLMTVSRDGRMLVALPAAACRIGIYDLATGQERFAPATGMRTSTMSSQLIGDGRYLVTAGGFPQSVVKVWDAASGQERTLVAAEPGGFAWLAGTDPTNSVILVRQTAALVAIDVASGAVKGRYPLPRTAASQAHLSTGGKAVLLMTYNDPTMQVLNFPSLEPRTVLKSAEPLTYLPPAFSADGNTCLIGDNKGNLHLWDMTTGKELPQRIPSVKGQFYSLALAPDGKTVAGAFGERWVKMWDVVSGEERLAFQDSPRDAFRGHGMTIRFSPDGGTLLSWNYQNVQLWQVADGKPRPMPRLPANQTLGQPLFSPDGRTLLFPAQEHLVFYDVATASETRINLPGSSFALSFSPDGRYLATGNSNGTCYILRLEQRGRASGVRPFDKGASRPKQLFPVKPAIDEAARPAAEGVPAERLTPGQ